MSEEVGIPETMRIKRKYTMTEAAFEQRRKAAQMPKPGMEGIRNNFKTGQHAKTFIGRIRPCKSTCDHYPCELVKDGATQPGADCLDKAELLYIVRAVHSALTSPKEGSDAFNDIAALNIANNITILEMLQEDIMRDGTIVKSEKHTKQGLHIEYKPHPSLTVLPKLLSELGMTPDNFMITPKAQTKQQTEEDGIKTIADMLGAVAKKLSGTKMEEKQ